MPAWSWIVVVWTASAIVVIALYVETLRRDKKKG